MERKRRYQDTSAEQALSSGSASNLALAIREPEVPRDRQPSELSLCLHDSETSFERNGSTRSCTDLISCPDQILVSTRALDPGYLQHWKKGTGPFNGHRAGLRTAALDFAKDAQTLAGGPPIPGRVDYPSHCTDLCNLTHTRRILQAERRLWEAWQKLLQDLSPAGRVANAALADIMLAHEVRHQGKPNPEFVFVAVANGCGRKGKDRAFADFIFHSPQGDQSLAIELPFAGLVLMADREARVEPWAEPRSPLNQASHGPLCSLCDDELSGRQQH